MSKSTAKGPRSWSTQRARDGWPAIVDDWDALNRRHFHDHPMLDSAFLGPLVEQFVDDETLLAIHRNEAGEVDGALLVQPRMTTVWSSFLPSQAQIAPAVLPSEVAKSSLEDLMRSLPRPCWMLEMLNQDLEFSAFRETSAPHLEKHSHATTMNIRLDGSFEDYWKSRPKKLRENLRRYFNRVKKEELELSLHRIVEPAEMSAALVRYGELESRGWKGELGTAIRSDNEQGLFYDTVLSNFAERDRALVYELRIGDKVVASRLCVSNGSMLVALKTTYDEQMSRLAPGRLLLYLVLESEFERSELDVIEFYTNATKELLDWSSSSREVFHVSSYRQGASGALLRHAKQSRARLARSVSALRTRATGKFETPASASAPAYAIEPITTYDAFMKLKIEWKQCCELEPYKSIFLTHEWFENFIHEVVREGSGAELAIFLVRRRNKIRAIFPMMSETMKLAGTTVRCCRFLGNYYSPMAKPIWATNQRSEKEEICEAVLAEVFRAKPTWPVVEFHMLPEETDDRDILQHALSAMHISFTNYLGSTNWIQPTTNLTAETYAAQLPTRVRNTVRRRLKRAEKQGRVECRLFERVEDVVAHIGDYYAVYERSWKRPEPFPTFHRRLAERMANQERVILGIIYFEGKPVAAQIWLLYENVASIVKLCYDEAYKDYSFGTILTYRLMSFVIDEKHVSVIDYLTGDDKYKRDWMSIRRERRGLLGFNPSSPTAALFAFVEGVCKPRLKSVANTIGAVVGRA